MASTRLRRSRNRPLLHGAVLGSLVAAAGCGAGGSPPVNTPEALASASPASDAGGPATALPARRHDAAPRADFNRAAVRMNLPLFWASDENHDGSLDPAEVAALLFYPSSVDPSAQAAGKNPWVTGGGFTPAFEAAYAQVVAEAEAPRASDAGADPAEATRRRLVVEDLDQGRPTLVQTDFSALEAPEREFATHVLRAAAAIDRLYAKQVGATALAASVPAGDLASQSLFRRDWGPRCLAPRTEKDSACSAIPGAPRAVCDAYPEGLQKGPHFCEALEKRKDAATLLSPFVVVRGDGESLTAVPYSVAYREEAEPVARELRAAAAALEVGGLAGADDSAARNGREAHLVTYLRAAAQSFVDDDWTRADEAWAWMNATNSRYYLRVAPDEVYWDPCNRKAGYHLTFARINQASLAWQAKLTPLEGEMETNLAARIGAPYVARSVGFHLPDFVDVVVNAGDDRKDSGATIGQSLPNWGPVANEGRGRTVAMSNLNTDPDSLAARREAAASLFTVETMAHYGGGPQDGLLATILHEATHNLGPAHEYAFQGKTDATWFGGSLSSMLEELKAQTGALYFVEFLQKKGLIDEATAAQTYVDALAWAFGHVSRGMVDAGGKRKPYSQLAAIQLGALLDAGALTWDPNAKAANGTDVGAFTVHPEALRPAIDALMTRVGAIKAKGDRAAALALVKRYVDGPRVPQATITERWLRSPKATFVYAVTF